MLNSSETNIWRDAFHAIFSSILDNNYLTIDEVAKSCHVNNSAVGHWRRGRCLPNAHSMPLLKDCLVEKVQGNDRDANLYSDIEAWLSKLGHDADFRLLKQAAPGIGHFVADVLDGCYHGAHKSQSPFSALANGASTTGKIRMVVFDFDGTLTKGAVDATTWERLWVHLGYEKTDCQELHRRFTNNEIDHAQWCQLTAEKFIARKLSRDQVISIGKSIELLDGVQETLRLLRDQGIPTFVVSGSILDIVNAALGDVKVYVDDVRANIFNYDDDGFLREIVGTKYDFEGKADYIREKAVERHISPMDVLFVGNSMNDGSAYKSGAETLCINPRQTDYSNKEVWGDWIETCENLAQILPFIFPEASR